MVAIAPTPAGAFAALRSMSLRSIVPSPMLTLRFIQGFGVSLMGRLPIHQGFNLKSNV